MLQPTIPTWVDMTRPHVLGVSHGGLGVELVPAFEALCWTVEWREAFGVEYATVTPPRYTAPKCTATEHTAQCRAVNAGSGNSDGHGREGGPWVGHKAAAGTVAEAVSDRVRSAGGE
jgi:hypothetical protein